MNTISLLAVAYAFVSTGFCLGFVTCAVLSGPRTKCPHRQEIPQ